MGLTGWDGCINTLEDYSHNSQIASLIPWNDNVPHPLELWSSVFQRKKNKKHFIVAVKGNRILSVPVFLDPFELCKIVSRLRAWDIRGHFGWIGGYCLSFLTFHFYLQAMKCNSSPFWFKYHNKSHRDGTGNKQPFYITATETERLSLH